MDHMRAAKSHTLFDLGMGLGKLLLQSFFQYPNLRYVCGVELALSRYRIAEGALMRLVELEVRTCTVPALLSTEPAVRLCLRLLPCGH
jgi:hypothetical protein